MKVYAELLHIAMMSRMRREIDPTTAFISIASTLAMIERKLPTEEPACREAFLEIYSPTVAQAWQTLRYIKAPTQKELEETIEGLTDALSGYSTTPPNRQNQDAYDNLLIGVDQMLCAGVIGHRVNKRGIAPEVLARQAKDRVLSLPETSGIYSFAKGLCAYPWKVVVNDTSIFGLWDDVAARGPAKVVIGPQRKKMAVSRR